MTQSLKDKPDSYWKDKLTPEQYRIVRDKDTEVPFSGIYNDHDEHGMYHCVACGEVLFSSDTKFDAYCGWPSFTDALDSSHIDLHRDTSHGMIRTEATCANCGAHLGHLFDDGPVEKGGLRYCINSLSLDFKKAES